jgi:hypothetical protein
MTGPSIDMPAFLATLERYYEAFAEHDPARRAALLERCFTPDGQIWGPNRWFTGYAEISEKIARFHDNWPQCRLVLASGFTGFDNVVRCAGALVDRSGQVVARGEKLIAVAPDGRFRHVVPMWEMQLPDLPASWPAHLGVQH